MSDDVITTFAIEQDQQSINRTLQTVEKLENGLDSIGLSASQSAEQIQRMSKDIQSIPEVDSSAGRLASPESLAQAFPTKDKISTRTATTASAEVDFGRAEGQFRAFGGAIAGLGDEAEEASGKVIGAGAELFALGDVVVQLGSQAGPAGIAIAAATIAVGIFAAEALGDVIKQSERAAEAVQRQIDADRTLAEATEQTSDEIKEQIAELERQIEVEKAVREETQRYNDALKAGEDTLRGSIGPIFDFGKTLGVWGKEVDTASDNLKEQKTTVKDLEKTHEALTEALKSQEVAANDARQVLLDEVDQLAEVRRFEQEALNSSAEQNAERARQIQNERAIIQEQIATLKASGDTSKEVQETIEELTDELGTLDEQTAILNSEAVKASEAQKALAESTGEVANAAKEAQQAQQAAIAAENKRFNELSKGLTELAAAETQAQAEIIAAQQEGSAEYLELINEQIEDSAEAERQRQKEINDIAERGRREAQDAAESFDFLGAFRKRQETAREVADAQAAADEKAAIEERGNIKIRDQLLRSIQEEALIRQAEAEAKIEQAANELLQQEVQAQTEIDQLQQTADEKNRILERAGQEEVNIASRTAQAQIDIATQSLNVLQQLQQTAVQQVQSIGSQISNITNNSITAFPNVTNLGGQTLSGIEQQMIQMIEMAAGG